MRGLILAAGRGSRLYPYTEECPKALTELAGKPLIQWQIDAMRTAGIDDIVIVNGYLAEMLEIDGTRQVTNHDWATTNMVDSLFCADGDFGDDLIISYSDIVYEPRIIAALSAAPHYVSVVVDTDWRRYWSARFDDPLSDAETLRLTSGGGIAEIGQKPQTLDEIEAQYIGLMRFKAAGIETLRRTKATLGDIHRDWMDARPVEKAYMTDLLMEMILRGDAVHAVPTDGGWLEIDTPEDMDLARRAVDGTLDVRHVYLDTI